MSSCGASKAVPVWMHPLVLFYSFYNSSSFNTPVTTEMPLIIRYKCSYSILLLKIPIRKWVDSVVHSVIRFLECNFLFLVLLCPTSSWMEARLTFDSNEARDTSTIRRLVTADVPLNPSATKQWYYIINSANRAGQCFQVQCCFHLMFQRLNDEAIHCTVRIVSLRQMAPLQSIIFIYPITPKTVRSPIRREKKSL